MSTPYTAVHRLRFSSFVLRDRLGENSSKNFVGEQFFSELLSQQRSHYTQPNTDTPGLKPFYCVLKAPKFYRTDNTFMNDYLAIGTANEILSQLRFAAYKETILVI